MDVNGISNSVASTAMTNTSNATKAADSTTKKDVVKEAAVVYEKSEVKVKDSAKKIYKPNTELVQKMQSDAQARMDQLQSLVQTLMTKQGKAFGDANVFTSDFWKKFSEDGMTIDQAAVKQAQEDVSEDGYWGVKQTSDRILDFAKAISGGNPDKIDEMRDAFEKGFKAATKSWGDELPQLSQDTYKAVMEKFDAWKSETDTK